MCCYSIFKELLGTTENIPSLGANLLISKLSTLRFEDVNITDPDLEEVFMHYYTRKES